MKLFNVEWMLFIGLLLNAAVGFVHGQQVNGTEGDETAWEETLVEAWRTQADCSPETGMCAACGFGVAGVDLNGPNGTAVTRTYTAGPGNLTAPWDENMTWEIASITKPFTAITALILQQQGILTNSLEESTVADFLDCNWTSLANSDIATVTLMELIQQQSGMPAQPPDRGPTIDGNPFANYTVDRLCASLLKLNGLPTRGRYSYSN
jgi:CubicO group peptidase (beta-lactamase class C family)